MPDQTPGNLGEFADEVLIASDDNVSDLEEFGGALIQRLIDTHGENDADLRIPLARIIRGLTSTQAANSKDLDNVALRISLDLATTAKANAADMIHIPPESGGGGGTSSGQGGAQTESGAGETGTSGGAGQGETGQQGGASPGDEGGGPGPGGGRGPAPRRVLAPGADQGGPTPAIGGAGAGQIGVAGAGGQAGGEGPCGLLDIPLPSLVEGMPAIGSKEFCDWLDHFAADLVTVENLIDQWAAAHLSSAQIFALLDSYEPQGSITHPQGYVADYLVRIGKTLIAVVGDHADVLFCALQSARALVRKVTPKCGSEVVIPLMTLKWILGALKDFELGIAFGIDLLDRVHLDFGPAEKFLDLLIEWAMPDQIPPVELATEAWLKGQIDERLRDCIWRLHGHCPAEYLKYALAGAERLTAEELLDYSYRKNWTDQERDTALKSRGWQLDVERSWRQELHWELPTIQDHLHWLSRNVDDRDYVQRFGLLDGFAPVEFIHALPGWGNYQIVVDPHGRDFWGTFGHDLTAQGMRPEIAAFHYASHWIQPSPEQMKEFIYRLRPDPARNIRGFTLDDYERILTEQDYAPLARQWFRDTAYHVPAISYIVSMYRQGVIDEAALQGYHQDLGYTPRDSERFVGVDRLQKAKIRASEFRGWSPMQIGNAWVMGRISQDRVFELMDRLGATREETSDMQEVAMAQLDRQIWQRARSRMLSRTAWQITRALDVGTMDAPAATNLLVRLGYPREQAESVVESEVASGRTAAAKKMVASIRSSLAQGYIDQGTAIGLLEQVGITDTRAQQYVLLWSVTLSQRHRRRTAAQIVADLSTGAIDTPEALARLTNLGYDDADQRLYLADAQRKIIGRQAKAQAAAQKDARTAAQRLEKLAKQAERQSRQHRAELSRIAPRSTLVRWLKKGLITANTFRERMAALGYPPDAIEVYYVDSPTEPKIAEAQKWLKGGQINDSQFIRIAEQLGYSAADAEQYRKSATAPAPAKAKTPAPGQSPAEAGAGGAATAGTSGA